MESSDFDQPNRIRNELQSGVRAWNPRTRSKSPRLSELANDGLGTAVMRANELHLDVARHRTASVAHLRRRRVLVRLEAVRPNLHFRGSARPKRAVELFEIRRRLL